MDVLKLPTDNLYIFLTVGGMFSIIFFLNKLLKSIIEIKIKINKIKKELSIIEIDVKSFDSQFELQKNVVEMHTYAFEKKFNVKFVSPENIDKEAEHEKLTIPESIEPEQIEKFILDYEKIINNITKLRNEYDYNKKLISNISTDNEEVKTLSTDLKQQLIIYFVIILFSLVISSIGFLAWYAKNQKYQDKIIKAQYEQLISKKNKEIIDTLKIAPIILNIELDSLRSAPINVQITPVRIKSK